MQSQPILTLTNNTTAEFDSGPKYRLVRWNRGRKYRIEVFCDILGVQKYSVRALPKIPYSTIAVNK